MSPSASAVVHEEVVITSPSNMSSAVNLPHIKHNKTLPYSGGVQGGGKEKLRRPSLSNVNVNGPTSDTASND